MKGIIIILFTTIFTAVLGRENLKEFSIISSAILAIFAGDIFAIPSEISIVKSASLYFVSTNLPLHWFLHLQQQYQLSTYLLTE